VAFWRKFFKKGGAAEPVRTRLSLADQYQKKFQCFMAIMAATEAAQELLDRLYHLMTVPDKVNLSQLQGLGAGLLQHTRQAMDLLQDFCKTPPEGLINASVDLTNRLHQELQSLEATGDQVQGDSRYRWEAMRALLFAAEAKDVPTDFEKAGAYSNLQDLLNGIAEQRLNEMFCLSLRGQVTKNQAASLITGRLVPILVIDVGGGLARPAATVHLDDVTSLPFRSFLAGMMSIPWPKARPLDMKGFISVIGVTSTTPRAEDQLQKVSLALLAQNYMNFSLCLGYHASTIESYVDDLVRRNYIRFHYQGGAASVERRVRRLRLIQGVLTRLNFQVAIEGDLLDARQSGQDQKALLKLLEILGRLEVFTKQMDMVMSDDEVIFGYIDEFLARHG